MGAILTDPAGMAALLPRDAALVGLDQGARTIGVAVSDSRRQMASPLTTIRRGKRLTADLEALLGLARDRHAAGFVLGLPRNMDGSEGPRCDSVRSFARSLARLTDLPILLWDERLTTSAAQSVLEAAGTSARRRREVIDQVAAAHILEDAMQALAGNGTGTA
jgi:putative holliday junction resolvase